MKQFKLLSIIILGVAYLVMGCSRYQEQQTVLIKLNGCKGTIIRTNPFAQSYKIRYVDHNGVCHTEQFEEFEIEKY